MEKRHIWHQMKPEEVLLYWGSHKEKGLTNQVAEKRLEYYGFNELREGKKISPWEIFINQFRDFMVLVLIGATLISALLGEYADVITILAIVLINCILGFLQEYRAEKSMAALKKLTAPKATVVRDGETCSIPARELVPGDLIILNAGDRVPADARIIETVNLEVEEATLTGESLPVRKNESAITEEKTELGDRTNMVYSGTAVTRGRARAIVVQTGMHTEVGQIAGMIQEAGEEDTPLQKRLEQLGRWLVVLCLGVCAVVVLAGVWQGAPIYRMFLAGVSLAVAAIPEGLPAIVTVALAVGVQKMIRRRAIIRRLPAVETLGCATVICSDKTGTLTQNKMTVKEVFTANRHFAVEGEGYEPRGDFFDIQTKEKVIPANEIHLSLALKISSLCNNAWIKKRGAVGRLRSREPRNWHVSGEPTEVALLVAAAKGGIWKEIVEKKEKRIAEIPFDSERKLMSVVCRKGNGGVRAFVKGAPENLLNRCTHAFIQGQEVLLDESYKSYLRDINEKMARRALRVLGLAYKDLGKNNKNYFAEDVENNLVFVGLVGMIDPPRSSAVESIQLCKTAGIKTVMITGDHQITAQAIAEELGLDTGEGRILTGRELDDVSDHELKKIIKHITVFARVSPKHKLRIVKALKAVGEIVAMTGDGVNDAPAVKEADIGVAMGKTGTDVTKEASSMILADDNFSTIVAAIEEGRSIYDNIRKFIRYLLSCNTGEIIIMFLATLAGLPLPLIPIQVLWVNLVTDGLPAMALGVDRPDPDIMLRPPRKTGESIFARGLSTKIIFRGLYIGLASLLVFVTALYLGDGDLKLARTMAFVTLVFSQLFHVFECRSERYSVFEIGFWSNPYLAGAVMVSITMQLAVVYTPLFQQVFQTVPLNGFQWGMVFAAAGGRTILEGIRHYLLVPLKQKFAFSRSL